MNSIYLLKTIAPRLTGKVSSNRFQPEAASRLNDAEIDIGTNKSPDSTRNRIKTVY